MLHETYVDAATAVTLIQAETHPADPRMHLTGTLRQHRGGYVIEQQFEVGADVGPRWTTPRAHRVMATDATRATLQSLVNQVVTITGTPGYGDVKNRTSIVLDSVQLLDGQPTTPIASR